MNNNTFDLIYSDKNKIIPAFEDNYISVVFSTDNDFLKYMDVMITSIINNSSSNHNYDIIVLHRNIPREKMIVVRSKIKNKKNISIRFVNIIELVTKKRYFIKSLYHGVTEESYYRLYIPQILSNQYLKTVYLDGDEVALKDLYELNNIQIDGFYVAAVRDFFGIAECFSGSSRGIERKKYQLEKIKINKIENYFNSGVLIINLQKIREIYSIEKVESIIFQEKWLLYDQDVINHICRDNKALFLDAKWNVICDYGESKYLSDELKKEYFEAEKEPSIIHFAGFKKPWKSRTPNEAHFWKYASMSSFHKEIIFNSILSFISKFGFDERFNEALSKDLSCKLAGNPEIKNIDCLKEISSYLAGRKTFNNTKIHLICLLLKQKAHNNQLEEKQLASLEMKIDFYIKNKRYLKEKEINYLKNILKETKLFRTYIKTKPTFFSHQRRRIKRISDFLSNNSNKLCNKEVIGKIGIVEYKMITTGIYAFWLFSFFPSLYYKIKEQYKRKFFAQ